MQVTVFDTSEVEINDALVSIDTGQSSNRGEFGMYEFTGVPVGDRAVSVTASADAVVLEDSITQVPFVLTASASGGPGFLPQER